MKCFWLKNHASYTEGIGILNNLDGTKFEQVLNRIVGKLKTKNSTIFTEDEKQKLEKIFQIEGTKLELALKTSLYICKRMTKFVLKPAELTDDLIFIGLSNDKAEAFLKVWSNETKDAVNNLSTQEDPNFSWKLSAELSSDVCKKSKIPKAYFMVSDTNNNIEAELLHRDLYSIFSQLESLQIELDNII